MRKIFSKGKMKKRRTNQMMMNQMMIQTKVLMIAMKMRANRPRKLNY